MYNFSKCTKRWSSFRTTYVFLKGAGWSPPANLINNFKSNQIILLSGVQFSKFKINSHLNYLSKVLAIWERCSHGPHFLPHCCGVVRNIYKIEDCCRKALAYHTCVIGRNGIIVSFNRNCSIDKVV